MSRLDPSISTETLKAHMDRLVALPELIETEGRQRVGMMADRREAELKLKMIEAKLDTQAMQSDTYQAFRNAAERKAYLDNNKYGDIDWQATNARIDKLSKLIDHQRVTEGALEHERKALYAVLSGYYARVIETALDEDAVVKMLQQTGIRRNA